MVNLDWYSQVIAVTARGFHKLLFDVGNQQQSVASHLGHNSSLLPDQGPACMGAARRHPTEDVILASDLAKKLISVVHLDV